MEDRFDQNIDIDYITLVKNFMLVRLVKKNFDFGHSGCHQAPINVKKRFGQNEGLPETFLELFLTLIMY